MSGKVEGLQETFAAFDRMGKVGEREGSKAVRAYGQKIHGTAVRKIQRGPATGAVYTRGGGQNLSSTHQASAPGEAPNTDSGQLARSGRVKVTGLSGTVTFTAPHAYWLEYGTLNMEARPFLEPSSKEEAQYFIDQLHKAIDKATEAYER